VPDETRFGDYVLGEQLATGGMAITWRARRVGAAGVTKPLVIKKVRPSLLEDPEFLRRFVDEARISATLSHGNIAQVFEFGAVAGEHFLAMEFVDGQSLKKLLERSASLGHPALPVELAVFIALELCKGLHYAHSHVDATGRPLHIVHRDVSPDNVMVSYAGEVKLVDFGIARAVLENRTETQPGVVRGKHLYFAPEQAQGDRVDARADVWSLGVVLYEMVCGRRPFDGPAHAAVLQAEAGVFPPPRTVNPQLAPELERIILRCLKVDREERFRSALKLQEALARFLYPLAPTISGETLKQTMRELFDPELHAEGRLVAEPTALHRARESLPEVTPTGPAPVTRTDERSPDSETRLEAVPRNTAPDLPSMAPSEPSLTHVESARPLLPMSTRDTAPSIPFVEPRTRWWPWVVLVLALLAVTVAAWRYKQAQREVPPAPEVVVPPTPALPVPVIADAVRPPPNAQVTPSEPSTPRQLLAQQMFNEAEALRVHSPRAAVPKYQKCLELDPSVAECRIELAVCLTRLGQPEQAIAQYRLFLSQQPTHPMAPKVRGIVEDYERSKRGKR
jgi:serine/threonine-protein kinase